MKSIKELIKKINVFKFYNLSNNLIEIEKFYKIKMDKSKIYELDSVKSILSYLTKIKKK